MEVYLIQIKNKQAKQKNKQISLFFLDHIQKIIVLITSFCICIILSSWPTITWLTVFERICGIVWMEINNGNDAEPIKQVDQNEIVACKNRMRQEMKKDKCFNNTDDIIRKILFKTDGDPTIGSKCVRWLGSENGSVRVEGRVYYIRRMLYHWYIDDLDNTHNIVNRSDCQFNMCCNTKHLVKMSKTASYKSEGKTYYGASRNLERTNTHKRNIEIMKRDSVGQNATKRTKIPAELIETAWTKIKSGIKLKRVAYDCKISIAMVRQIAKGSTWNSVTGLPPLKPKDDKNTSRTEITKKKREIYLKKNCQYKLRDDIPEEEIPTLRELYRVVKIMDEPFAPMKDYEIAGERKGTARHCIYSPKVIRHRGKRLSRARLIYYWFKGDIPQKCKIVKLCKDKKKNQGECMRPEHLSLRFEEQSLIESEDINDSYQLSDLSSDLSSDSDEEYLLDKNTDELFDGLEYTNTKEEDTRIPHEHNGNSKINKRAYSFLYNCILYHLEPMASSFQVDWDDVIRKWKNEKQTCYRCGIEFTYYNSIGKWQCKQHPARDRVEFRLGDKWPCCSKDMIDNKRLISCGCVPCDHIVRDNTIYPLQDDIELPTSIVDELNIPVRAQRNKTGSTSRIMKKTTMVMRCDPIAYEERNGMADNHVLQDQFGIDLSKIL